MLDEARLRNPQTEYKPSAKYVSVPSNTTTISTETNAKSPKRRVLKTLASIASNKLPALSTETLPQDEKERHLLIYKGQTFDPADLTLLSEKIAEELVANDQRLKGDVKLILASLLEDPYGQGCYKIVDAKPVKENGQTMPPRSFRGDARRLPFENKKYSDKLRAVYYINPKTRSVTLVQIITHDKFNNLYGGHD